MSEFGNGRLWELLPAIHRIRDAETGSTLRALIGVIGTQVAAVESDVQRMYENWFVETCEEWVVPYIGDLLSVRGARSIASAGFSARSWVGNTLRYRRRKGTRAVIERLAGDAAGWPASAVEFFALLSLTQNLNHLRPGNLRTPDLRDAGALELLGGPFETAAHTAEIRSAARGGKYGFSTVGVFLWRLEAFEVAGVAAAPALPAEGAPGLFRFSPLGRDLPLFNRRGTSADLGDVRREPDMPGPLRRRALYDDLDGIRQAIAEGSAPEPDYFDEDPVLQLMAGGAAIPREQIIACDLSDWKRPPATRSYRRADGTTVALPILVAVDPVLGRIAFRTADVPATLVCSYYNGFSARIGGGSWDRAATLTPAGGRTVYFVAGGGGALAAAIAQWTADAPASALIEIGDSLTYAPADVAVPVGLELEIRAANEQRPLVRTANPMVAWRILLADGAQATLDGLLVAAGIELSPAGETSVALRDVTLVPGRSLRADGAPAAPDASSLAATAVTGKLRVNIERCICGRIVLPADRDAVVLEVADSIVDGTGGTPPALVAGAATLQRTTVLGSTRVAQLTLASDSLCTGGVQAGLTQLGCIRFSYAPDGSRLPRRYRCQPDLALAGVAAADRTATLERLDPCFTSEQYGDPGYAQLSLATALELREGAADGSEMGAFQSLHQPQRLASLRAGLDEYLPYGLEAGTFFVT